MKTVAEGDIEIAFPSKVGWRKFDADYGLSHCMKAVDFILEYEDKTLFIEIKDFANPNVPREGREKPIEKHNAENRAEKITNVLTYKYRDSFLYEWASGRTQKPVHYYVLIAAHGLDKALLVTINDTLNRKLPIKGPASNPWKRSLAATCLVFNIETWNEHVADCRVARVSEKCRGRPRLNKTGNGRRGPPDGKVRRNGK